MLEASDITFRVGGRALISDVSIKFAPGRLHLVIGPNGAGKADLARRRAVLSQAVEIAFPLTAREVVMMGRHPHFGARPGPADEKVADEMLELFDAAEFGGRGHKTLTG